MLQEFLPGNDTITMRDEIEENIENLRLDGAQCSRVTEFVEFGMQGVVIEKVYHSYLAGVQKYPSERNGASWSLTDGCTRRYTVDKVDPPRL